MVSALALAAGGTLERAPGFFAFGVLALVWRVVKGKPPWCSYSIVARSVSFRKILLAFSADFLQ